MDYNEKRSAEIARRNDVSRKLGLGVTITERVAELPNLEGLLRSVRAYNNFTPKNDPYGAHDMGFFTWGGEDVIWKFDYYDKTLKYGEDPISLDCKRILTVMLAKEY